MRNSLTRILSSAEQSGARIEGCSEPAELGQIRTLRYGFRYAPTYSGCYLTNYA